jgi:malonyl-CoA/methylmalonyl-CoA synthetase
VEQAPHKACLVFEGQTYSYAHLWGEARRWAAALARWGLERGDRVALYLQNSPAFLAAYLGTHLAGGIVVLVNTQYRQVELRHLLGDSEARVCVADAGGAPELERVRGALPALERVVLADAPADFLSDADASGTAGAVTLPPPDDVAVIAYTSGTTGRSKGAMLTHANLAANARAVTAAWRWTGADSLLLMLPLFHVHGLCVGMHGTWLVGGTAELYRRFDAAVAYERIAADAGTAAGARRPTMFFGVPTMYTRLIAEAEKRLAQGGARPGRLRLFVSGSGPLSVQTFERFERLFGQRILERYGMSETIMNLTNPYDGERRPGTVGMPFPGQEARIVDVRTRRPLPDQTPGEIQVRGPHVCKGYWRREDATAEAFDAEGWFNTGDLGWRSADGYFTISGRARELIITGGYNVYPREVEEVLETHPAVAEAGVVGLPDAEFGEQIAAAVVLADGAAGAAAAGSDLTETLAAHCREHLASYKKPKRVVVVESLPRNALGKVQKHLLRAQLERATDPRSGRPADA